MHQFLSEQAKNMDGGQVGHRTSLSLLSWQRREVPLDKFVITKGLTKDPKDTMKHHDC